MSRPQRGGGPPSGPVPPVGPSSRHTIDLSNAWQPPDPGTPTGWSRSFGRPAELDPGERVWLVLDAGRDCSLILNGSALAPVAGPQGRSAEITGLLASRNRLLLVPADGETPLPPDSSRGDSAGGLRGDSAGGLRGDSAGGLRGTRAAHGRCPLPAAYGRIRLEFEPRIAGHRSDETPSGA